MARNLVDGGADYENPGDRRARIATEAKAARGGGFARQKSKRLGRAGAALKQAGAGEGPRPGRRGGFNKGKGSLGARAQRGGGFDQNRPQLQSGTGGASLGGGGGGFGQKRPQAVVGGGAGNIEQGQTGGNMSPLATGPRRPMIGQAVSEGGFGGGRPARRAGGFSGGISKLQQPQAPKTPVPSSLMQRRPAAIGRGQGGALGGFRGWGG